MKDPYGKGSIILKFLILVLAGVLAVTILYPKMLWDEEEKNRELGRYRMSQIYNAELQFQRFKSGYTDTLDVLLSFVKTDSQYHAYVDSIIVANIHKSINMLDTVRQIQVIADNLIDAATDSTIADSIEVLEDRFTSRSREVRNILEYIREKMLTFPALPVSTFDLGLEIIERKDYFLKAEVVRRMVKEVGDLRLAKAASAEAIANVDSIAYHLNNTIAEIQDFPSRIDSLKYCPTVHRPYVLALEDSGVFKFVNVYCPIDSDDISKVEADFLKSTVGSLRLQNHGSIIKNEKSWEEES